MFSGFHNPARITARLHWKKTLLTVMRRIDFGNCPAIAKRARRSGCASISAVPFTRNVSPIPGTMNSSATRGSINDVPQAIDPVVPAPVGQDQGVGIFDMDKARRVATRGGIQSLRPCRRQNGERSGLNEGPIDRVDMIHLLNDRWRSDCTI